METQIYKTKVQLKSYKDLIVWQKSMSLVTMVFELKTKNYDLSTKI